MPLSHSLRPRTTDRDEDGSDASGSPPPPPYRAREETSMKFHSTHCGHDEESEEPHALWKRLQRQRALPPVMRVASRLPCSRCAGDEAGGTINSWIVAHGRPGASRAARDGGEPGPPGRRMPPLRPLANAPDDGGRGGLRPHVAVAHGPVPRAEVLGLPQRAPARADRVPANARHRGGPPPAHDRGAGPAARAGRGRPDLPHLAVRAEPALRGPGRRLRRLRPDGPPGGPRPQRPLPARPAVPGARAVRGGAGAAAQAVPGLRPARARGAGGVGKLRRSLPVRELVDPVAMPGGDDARISFVEELEESVVALVRKLGDLLELVEELEDSPYPAPREKFKYLPFGEDHESDDEE
ncbi:hypothetical protein PG991_012151 [Apiospora marii]|uniref:Uncharacterized protein n=1 Tax=Apiospora marii TaxID=335849 RepID=A0ABR1R8Y4_9PEZI